MWVASLLAVLSAAAMAVIAIHSDVPYAADSARVYFGTDTHSTGLFLGSAAGAWTVLHAARPSSSRLAFLWLTDILAVAALGLLGWEFLHLDEFRPALYRGGFLLLDCLALMAVCAVVRRGSGVAWLLDRKVPRWIGQRSYSIYLWHWPVVVVTRPGIDIHGPLLVLDLARAGLILLLAELSYRFVENPLRSGSWRERPRTEVSKVVLRLPAACAVACLVVLWLAAGPGLIHSTPSPDRAISVRQSAPPSSTPTTSHAATEPSPATPSPLTPSPPAQTGAVAASTTAHPAPPAAPPAPAPVPVTGLSAFGDSVLLGAATALQQLDSKADVDAVEGRQANLVLNDVVTRHQHAQLGSVVVIHVGNNGIINPSQLSSVLSMLADRRRVVVLNDRVPRDWQAPNNATLASVTGQFPNVRFIDWYAISGAHPDWFYAEGCISSRPVPPPTPS